MKFVIPHLSESEKLPSAIVVDGDQRPVKVLIMNEHDNLSRTLFMFGSIKYVQLTLLCSLIVLLIPPPFTCKSSKRGHANYANTFFHYHGLQYYNVVNRTEPPGAKAIFFTKPCRGLQHM